VPEQDFLGCWQAVGQDDAGGKGPDASCDRANDGEAGISGECRGRENKGEPAARVLPANGAARAK